MLFILFDYTALALTFTSIWVSHIQKRIRYCSFLSSIKQLKLSFYRNKKFSLPKKQWGLRAFNVLILIVFFSHTNINVLIRGFIPVLEEYLPFLMGCGTFNIIVKFFMRKNILQFTIHCPRRWQIRSFNWQ